MIVEQRIRNIADIENRGKTCEFHHQIEGRTMWKSQGHIQFDELCVGEESIQN